MSTAFGRDALLDAFDQIGRAAVEAGTKLQIAGLRRFGVDAGEQFSVRPRKT